MSQITTAGRLLLELFNTSPQMHAMIVAAAGITAERAAAAADGTLRLTLLEQFRLSEAAAASPRHRRLALRLRDQALAAQSFERGDVARTRPPSAERWERRSEMRR